MDEWLLCERIRVADRLHTVAGKDSPRGLRYPRRLNHLVRLERQFIPDLKVRLLGGFGIAEALVGKWRHHEPFAQRPIPNATQGSEFFWDGGGAECPPSNSQLLGSLFEVPLKVFADQLLNSESWFEVTFQLTPVNLHSLFGICLQGIIGHLIEKGLKEFIPINAASDLRRAVEPTVGEQEWGNIGIRRQFQSSAFNQVDVFNHALQSPFRRRWFLCFERTFELFASEAKAQVDVSGRVSL